MDIHTRMFAALDLERPHAFCTRLHAVRGSVATAPKKRSYAIVDRVRATLGASIDKEEGLLLERWRSDAPSATRAIFESEVRVNKACALVSAAAVEYDDGERVTLAPWDDDALQCLIVPLPYRTTGVLRLRCEAAPFEERDGGFRLKLRCDKWSHEVSVRRL